ncbi:MAG: hypothetical protein ACFFD4_29035 [Candidatus Odinarchaeota archaeon]
MAYEKVSTTATVNASSAGRTDFLTYSTFFQIIPVKRYMKTIITARLQSHIGAG